MSGQRPELRTEIFNLLDTIDSRIPTFSSQPAAPAQFQRREGGRLSIPDGPEIPLELVADDGDAAIVARQRDSPELTDRLPVAATEQHLPPAGLRIDDRHARIVVDQEAPAVAHPEDPP